MKRTIFLFLLVIVATGCSNAERPADKLNALFEEEWQIRMEEFPLTATQVGVHDYNDRLPQVSFEDLQRRNELWIGFLSELAEIDREALNHENRVNYAIFHRQLENRIRGFEFGDYQIPLNADSGFHSSIARLPQNVPLQTLQDYENYLSRLRQIPRYFSQQTTLMRMGLESGMSLPRVVLDGIEHTMTSHVVDDPRSSVFYGPFEDLPAGIVGEEQERLKEAARGVISADVVPAYRSLADFMVAEYIPRARESLAASKLPRGRDYYDWLIEHHTTLDLSAGEVHRVGLDEVARIRKEMEQIIADLAFEGDFQEFLQFLRTDPQFYAKTPQELLRRAAWIAKRMDGKLPVLFKTLPRLPYTIEAVPEHMAPKYTAGRYVGAPLGSTRPGIYWVNTYALESRPFYTQAALTLHEAVPGHHLQNALRRELEGLPNFRRFSGVNAYGEGWGLYAEYLGLETGFYEDPYDNFGRLTYEMWRACRLAVDTGIHAMDWTRQQSIEFLASNTALSLHECTTETDRYISWPGQALAYKIGELKIRELRRKGEEALGTRFDVREFHDTILLSGPVPLDVLEENVNAYIEATGDP